MKTQKATFLLFQSRKYGKGGVFKKGEYPVNYFHTNLPFPVLFFSEWFLCVFYLLTPYLLIFFVFHVKNLTLLNLIGR